MDDLGDGFWCGGAGELSPVLAGDRSRFAIYDAGNCTTLCRIPDALGRVTGMHVTRDRLVVETESGIQMIAPTFQATRRKVMTFSYAIPKAQRASKFHRASQRQPMSFRGSRRCGNVSKKRAMNRKHILVRVEGGYEYIYHATGGWQKRKVLRVLTCPTGATNPLVPAKYTYDGAEAARLLLKLR